MDLSTLDIYTAAIRPLLFHGVNVDPEQAHHWVMQTLSWLDTDRPLPAWLRQQVQQTCSYQHPTLKQTLWGLEFPNPIGLAAGFDKDGVAAGAWSSFGFGFTELGTVTFHPQPGNPQPRLFRLLQDQAILNRMGFNNQGAAVLAERLAKQQWGNEGTGRKDNAEREEHRDAERKAQLTDTRLPTPDSRLPIPIGINLGKSKITPLEAAAEDYLASFRLLKDWGDYFVINVSSPNTPGLRSLQATEQLAPILSALQQENQSQKPMLIKIAPDLAWEDISAVLELAQIHRLAGIIATNTTIQRDQLTTRTIATTGNPITEEAGGISGAPLRQRATEIIRFIYQQTQGELPIIGVGGVFTAEDAWEKIVAGASLVQVYTGWVYEGPWMVKRILAGLVQKLEQHRFSQITDAVGKDI